MGSADRSERADAPARRGRTSLLAVVGLAGIATVLVLGAITLDVLDGDTGTLPPAEDRGFPRERGVGLCLAIAPVAGLDTDELVARVDERIARQPHLFPSATRSADASLGIDGSVFVTARPLGGDGPGSGADASEPCRPADGGWVAAISRDLLSDGADRLLADADINDPWTGAVDVSLDAGGETVRSLLRFTGPLGISGTCWVDETLSVDPTTAAVAVSAASGDDAGFAGMVACTRFADSMPDGAAGAQALALVPHGDGGIVDGVRLLVSSVEVTPDAIVVQGRIETDAG